MLLDLLSIAFPNNCIGCKNTLIKGEKHICLSCYFKIPFFDKAIEPAEYFSDIFIDKKAQIGGLFLFDKKGIVQAIIHQIKYNNNLKLGEYLGELLGGKISDSHNIDFIMPVPMHKKKQKKRGYNQAEIIANGISKVIKAPVVCNVLVKIKETETQTRKTKGERLKNVNNSLMLNLNTDLIGKNILLVDDVITTGATVLECVKVVSQIKEVNIFIVSLGIVKI